MTVTELHYDFKLKVDKVDTLTKEDFNAAEVDWLLNEAQELLIRRRMGQNNNKVQGFEGNQKRIDDLKTLHVKFPLQPGIVPTLDSGVYEVDLSDLAHTYYFLTRAYCDVNDGSCVTQAEVKITQNDDLTEVLRDPFNKPDQFIIPANFGQSSSSNGEGSLYLYPGSNTIDNVYIEYLRKPLKISLGTYTYIDNTTPAAQTSELPEHLHPELVTQAVELVAIILNDPAHPLYREYTNISE